jgi:hypothetical protein
MRTFLIVHERQLGAPDRGIFNTFDLGVRRGPSAKARACETYERIYGVVPTEEQLCYTPKVVAGVRYYIAVHRG